MPSAHERRERLARARLYFVTDACTDARLLRAALEGGADMLQLRDPSRSDAELLQAGALFRQLCDEYGALFWVNDRPDLALRLGADGVHVGQDDLAVPEAREAGRGELLVGRSPAAAAGRGAGVAAGADQLGVGPVWETPTKPGRPAAGLGYVRHAAARRPPVPWFAIGGIDARNVSQVADAGAERVVAVRAIRDAADPRAAAAAIRVALARRPLGSAAR